jgi:hypothetical protein
VPIPDTLLRLRYALVVVCVADRLCIATPLKKAASLVAPFALWTAGGSRRSGAACRDRTGADGRRRCSLQVLLYELGSAGQRSGMTAK